MMESMRPFSTSRQRDTGIVDCFTNMLWTLVIVLILNLSADIVRQCFSYIFVLSVYQLSHVNCSIEA